MKKMIVMLVTVLMLTVTILISKPSFNGNSPGCGGGGCHSLQDGDVQINSINNLQVQIKVNNVSSGEKVAGELVDMNGNVVDVIDKTSSNPFTLTAPAPGTYRVNAGFKKPSKKWDSLMVDLGVTGIQDNGNEITPRQFTLYPNHPNPFNSETILRFSLPRAQQVVLAIYDVNGRLIRRLADGAFEAGIHSVRWDGKDVFGNTVSSGIYIYEVIGDRIKAAGKMMFAK